MHVLTTGIGSMPYKDTKSALEVVFEYFDIPYWVQLPNRSNLESMSTQFDEGLPDFSRIDISEQIKEFYQAYIKEDVEVFSMTSRFSPGFFEFINFIDFYRPEYVKCQITGPVSLGLMKKDKNDIPVIYKEDFFDVLVKFIIMKALWQIRRLQNKEYIKWIIIYLDEPYLSAIDSGYHSINKKNIKLAYQEIFKELKAKIKDKLKFSIGIHCCSNIDWSFLLDLDIDIISFDAYKYLDKFLLYKKNIIDFIAKGGIISAGVVPIDDMKIIEEEIEEIKINGMEELVELSKDAAYFLLTPSCGLARVTEASIRKICEKLKRFKELFLCKN